MRWILIIIISAIILAGCNRNTIVDYAIEIYLVFKNDSSHNIIMTKTNTSTDSWIRVLPETISLAPTESYSQKVLSDTLCDVYGKAIFDGKLVVDYNSLSRSKHHITYSGNYTPTKDGPYLRYYTYTFTDADYQFALEHDTPVE